MKKSKKPVKTKTKKSKNLVFFVEDSSPKVKQFKTPQAAFSFAEFFMVTHPNMDDGYWVDNVIVDFKEIVTFEGPKVEK